MKKILLIMLVVLPLIALIGCYDGDRWEEGVNVPYFESTTGHSAAHCVALWSNWNGPGIPEDVIITTLNCMSGLECINALPDAISYYTGSIGWQLDFPNSDAGQNEALATVREANHDQQPAIVPFFGDEFFLAIKYGGSKQDGVRIAERMRFHNLTRDGLWEFISEVKIWFKPMYGKYLIVVGDRSYKTIALQNYQQFCEEGGTYLGAPKDYTPETSSSTY